MKILIIEDSVEQQQTYKDNIDEFNKKNEIKIDYMIKGTYEEGIDLLSNHIFDAAILDIKLGGEDTEGKGNLIIKAIKNKLRFPIFIVSGFPDDLNPEYREESIFFRIFERGKVLYSDVLNDILSIYQTGLTKVLGGRGVIEDYLNIIFWNHLSKSMDIWIKHNNEKTLLRYVLSHIQEYLDLNESGRFEKYNTEEVYIAPPIKEFIYTGSVLQKNGTDEYYIVLSPSCDLAQKKAKQILLCKIEDFYIQEVNDQLKKLSLEFKTGMPPKEYQSIYQQKYDGKSTMKELLGNNYNLKYHFLPASNYFKGGFINFQLVTSSTPSVLKEDYKELFCITSPFCKDIVSRFAHYYSRQGSPDFDIEQILNDVLLSKGITLDIKIN